MLCFSSSGMSESPTHSCKVQWDCWLISVQPYSQCGKSLADERHTPEQVAQTEGESLVSCSETQLTPSLPSACVFSQIRSNLAIRNDRGDRLTFTQLWTKKFALGSQKQAVPQDWLPNLSCCFCKPSSASVAFPVAHDTCQWFGAETQPLAPAPGGNTTLSDSFLLQTHVYLLIILE